MNTSTIHPDLARQGYTTDDQIVLVNPVSIVGTRGSMRGVPHGAAPRGRMQFVRVGDLNFGDRSTYHDAHHPQWGKVQIEPSAVEADRLVTAWPDCEAYRPAKASWDKAREGRSTSYAEATAA